MTKYFITSINKLVDTFSSISAGREFKVNWESSEFKLTEYGLKADDLILACIDETSFYLFQVLSADVDGALLEKRFEVASSIIMDSLTESEVKEIDESTFLSICRKLFEPFLANIIEENIIEGTFDVSIPRNKIIYGAPGTGKSFELRDQARSIGFTDDNTIRVTFHPNYSYQQFVGTYKPTPIYKNVLQEGAVLYGSDKTTELENNHKREPLIDYNFVPGPLMKQLVYALTNPGKNYLLIIEEINRASVSAVFGDVFQLLDRKEDGTSEYSITFNEEAMSFLRANGIPQTEIKLPNNLFIWATMNSADQGVMPLDAAFKRRWAFEYLPLNEKQNKVADRIIKFQGKEYNWNHFRKQINDKLKDLGIVEDKLIGPFFMNSNELSDENSIKNKLLLYLRDDVVRHNPEGLFKKKTYSDIIEMYSKGEKIFVDLEIKTDSDSEVESSE